MKIGDRVFVHGYVDEIRRDTVIIRNEGGYFGTVPSEIVTSMSDAEFIVRCKDCKWWKATENDIIVGKCTLYRTHPASDWYCANGKRRENG